MNLPNKKYLMKTNKKIKDVPTNKHLSGDVDQTKEGQWWLSLLGAMVNQIKRQRYIFPKLSLKFPESYKPKRNGNN